MKKLLSLLFSLGLVVALAACNNQTPADNGNTTKADENPTTAENKSTDKQGTKESTFDEFLSSFADYDMNSARSYAVDKAKSIDVSNFNVQDFLTKNIMALSAEVSTYEDGEQQNNNIYYYLTTNGPVLAIDGVKEESEPDESGAMVEKTVPFQVAYTVDWSTFTTVFSKIAEAEAALEAMDLDDLYQLISMLNAKEETPALSDGVEVEPSDDEGDTEELPFDEEAIAKLLDKLETLSLEDLGLVLTSANFKQNGNVYELDFASLADVIFNVVANAEKIAVECELYTAATPVEGEPESHFGLTKDTFSGLLLMADQMFDVSVFFDGQFKGFEVKVYELPLGDALVTGSVKVEIGYEEDEVSSFKLTVDADLFEVQEEDPTAEGEETEGEETEGEEEAEQAQATINATVELSKTALVVKANLDAGELLKATVDCTLNENGLNGSAVLNAFGNEMHFEAKTNVTELAGLKSLSMQVHGYLKAKAPVVEEGAEAPTEEDLTQDLFKVIIKTNTNVRVPDEIKAIEATNMTEYITTFITENVDPIIAMIKGATATTETE